MAHRLARVGVPVVAAAFLGYWALLVYCDVWQPVPLGALVGFDAGALVIADTVSGGPAEAAGLHAGDRVVSIDGHAIDGRLAWLAVETNLEVGRPTRWVVDHRGMVSSIEITPALGSWRSWRAQKGVELLVIRSTQLVALVLAILVAVRRPDDATALLGSTLMAAIGVSSVTLPYQLASAWRALPWIVSVWLWIPFIGCAAIGAWALAFFAVFPRVRFRTPLAWSLVWIPVIPGLVGHAIFGYFAIVRGQPPPPLPFWMQGLLPVGAVYILGSLIALVLNYRGLTDVNERRRVRIVMFGVLIGGISGTLVILSYWRTSANGLGSTYLSSPFATIGTFLFLVMPFAFAYAILRHRLFDVGVMIRQGLRYALARRALLALVPALIAALGVDLLAHGDEPTSDVLRSRVWVYLAIAGAAVLARSRRRQWLDALDRRFFRDQYNAQRLLRQVAEDVRQSSSLAIVAPAVVSRIEHALHATFVELLVRDGGRSRYRTLAVAPSSRPADSLDVGNKLLALTRLIGQPVEVAGSQSRWLASKLPAEDIASVQSAGIELVVPVRSEDPDAGGLFVLGGKRSEEPYSDDDKELLMAVAEGVAVRLSTAAEAAAEGFEECPACGGCYDSGTRRCTTDGAALTPVTAPRLLAGRYQIERRLGRGGAGTVYVALDLSLKRRVAAKLVREDLLGADGAASRFQREARVAAAFSHPNVVTVHDFGVAGAHAYLVMELMDSGTLRDTLRAADRIEVPRALAILRDVTSAVEAAHRRQLIHRDLKPENICLVSDGSGERAKVLDFGIAKFLTPAAGDPLTTSLSGSGGAVVGTPLYMAPEQLRGEDPDPSWDLWALAVIAFEMLGGSHPFAFATGGRRVATREGAADERLAHLPHGCQQFLARALAIDRTARPDSAGAFLTALEHSLHG